MWACSDDNPSDISVYESKVWVKTFKCYFICFTLHCNIFSFIMYLGYYLRIGAVCCLKLHHDGNTVMKFSGTCSEMMLFHDDWLWCVLQSVSALQPRTHEWLWRLRIAGVQSWNSPDVERDRSLNKDKAEWEFVSTMCVISVITVSFPSSISSVCYCRVSLSTLSPLLLPCLLLSPSFPCLPPFTHFLYLFFFPFLVYLSFFMSLA